MKTAWFSLNKFDKKNPHLKLHVRRRVESSEAMESLEKSTEKKIAKLKYNMETENELIGDNEYTEMV